MIYLVYLDVTNLTPTQVEQVIQEVKELEGIEKFDSNFSQGLKINEIHRDALNVVTDLSQVNESSRMVSISVHENEIPNVCDLVIDGIYDLITP